MTNGLQYAIIIYRNRKEKYIMKRTIAVKRAELLKEWFLAQYGNNENYYYSTLYTGIPDGDTMETVIEDLQDGFYDDDIDDRLDMYRRVRERYEKDGYYYNDRLYDNAESLLDAIGLKSLEKITKTETIKISANI